MKKKVYKGVKGEQITMDVEDQKELKRQWSMVEKQNRKHSGLHCIAYDKESRVDMVLALGFLVLGVVIICTFVLQVCIRVCISILMNGDKNKDKPHITIGPRPGTRPQKH